MAESETDKLWNLCRELSAYAQEHNILFITAMQPYSPCNWGYSLYEDYDENGNPRPKVIFIDYLNLMNEKKGN